MQATVSMPFALIFPASSTYPGRCFASQVGVNAPGTENNTTFLPPKSCSVVIFCGPSFVICVSVPDGSFSPTLMVMGLPSGGLDCGWYRIAYLLGEPAAAAHAAAMPRAKRGADRRRASSDSSAASVASHPIQASVTDTPYASCDRSAGIGWLPACR